jgi:hypothetical protein
MSSQCVSLLLIVLGEVAIIYAEISGAYLIAQRDGVLSWQHVMLLVVCLCGSALLYAGYVSATAVFRDIWVVSAISASTVLLVEPGVAHVLFQELPAKGALVGILCGMAGLIVTLVW